MQPADVVVHDVVARSMGFFKGGNRGTQLYMRSDAHGERAQKVYALDYCAASFVTEGTCLILIVIFLPYST